jgi:hypothetical protein
MFGFGKTAIPLQELAEVLANASLSLLLNPTAQDFMFQTQAVAVGMDKTRFLLEATALQYFTVSASIGTRLLDGGIKREQASSLMESMFQSFHRKFHDELPTALQLEFLSLGLDIDEAFDFIVDRYDEYSNPENSTDAHKGIPRLFATLCDVLDTNDVLQRIGWSLFAIRGNIYLDTLKGLKIV